MNLFQRNRTAGEFILRFARLKRIGKRKPISRILGNEDAMFLSGVLLMRRLEAEGFASIAEEDEQGFFARLIDWLADPENQAKLEAIIKWFMELLDSFDPV